MAAAGRLVEEDDACVDLGGPTQYLRAESSGSGGAHVWTGTTNAATAGNYATYTLSFAQAGRYLVRAYVSGDAASSREARYRIRSAGGTDDVYADQSAAHGFFELGTFQFSANTAYTVRIDDNTGESTSRRLRFDAIAVSPPPASACASVRLTAGTSALNVRPRPNTARAAVSQLTGAQTAVRLADVPGAAVNGNTAWQRVRVGQTIGYVSAVYTRCTN